MVMVSLPPAAARCAALLLLLGSWAVARTVRVPAEFRDIQKAVDHASAADTVAVDSGLYKETLQLHDSVVLIGAGRGKTVVFGVENKPVVTVADYSVVRELTLRGGSCGVFCPNKSAVIERCIITENRECGIHCLISLPLIRDNVISRNKSTGIFCESVQGFRGVRLEHNVVAENGANGLMLAGKSEIMVLNNVFVNNRQYGVWAAPTSRRSIILYNCFYNNRTAANRNATVNKTNIAVDPAYEPLGPGGYDYLRSKNWPLRGLGKDGVDIGLTEE